MKKWSNLWINKLKIKILKTQISVSNFFLQSEAELQTLINDLTNKNRLLESTIKKNEKNNAELINKLEAQWNSYFFSIGEYRHKIAKLEIRISELEQESNYLHDAHQVELNSLKSKNKKDEYEIWRLENIIDSDYTYYQNLISDITSKMKKMSAELQNKDDEADNKIMTVQSKYDEKVSKLQFFKIII